MDDREKLDNLSKIIDGIIDTCKSEIKISEKLIVNAEDNTEVIARRREKSYWTGKLEVAGFIKMIIK